ncbi:MAG: hypothetical protein MUF51_10210 [Vicinamibacteria bacterium]|nr:hypothetical protein [Vicinamibacteria bacterium]
MQRRIQELESEPRAEVETLKAEIEKTRAELAAEKSRGETALAEMKSELGRELESRTRERDEARSKLADSAARIDAAATDKNSLEAERDRTRTEVNQLWATIQSLQTQILSENDRFGEEKKRLIERLDTTEARMREAETLRVAAEKERNDLRDHASGAIERAREAEEQAKSLSARWDKTISAFKEAFVALRRTPFVPPTLRVCFAEAEPYLQESPSKAPGASPRVMLLDRDTGSLERFAGDIEAAGVDVLIAHYPEEVGLFLRSPEGRQLTALVCDVMALRSDQNLLEIVRAWRNDHPNLGLLLTFKADNSNEAERAQRIPVVFVAGYIPRPLDSRSILDAVATILRRQPGRGEA